MAAGPTTMPVLEADGTTIRTLLGVQDGSNQFSAGAMLVHPTTGAALIGQATMAASLPVVIASNQTAVPVSSTTLATAAKQPALGTAGTPSSDVITVQGITNGTPQPVQAGGYTAVVFGTMTRPADTTAYAAGDGVTTATSSASAMTVTNAARTAAGSGVLLGGKATKSTTSTTNAQFRGWIYQAAPTAIPNDNAAFTAAVSADYQKLVCTFTVDFSAGIVGSDGVEAPITLDRVNPGFKLASGQDLTVIWEARAAYTPGNAEIFRLALDAVQD